MSGKITARRLAAAGVSAAVLGVAACGSATGGSTGPPAGAGTGTGHPQATAAAPSAGTPLCAGTARVDRVVMRLTAARSAEILPRAMTITAPPRAAALAAALCALPRMPGGMRCPAALGGALRLEFTAGGRSYRPVLIRDSGCASVTGVGPVRQWAWSSRPGRLLSEAAGGYGRLVAGTPSEQRAHALSWRRAAVLSEARTATGTSLPPRSVPLTDG